MCKQTTSAVMQHSLLAAADEWQHLPSGLTVVVHPMEGYSSTHAIYATRFGSIDMDFRLGAKEVAVPAGVAHFLEHKMFEDKDGDAFAKYAKTGASANAFTSFDRTCYIFTATDNVQESLDVLLGMVAKPYFTAQTIEKEQGIIGQEIKMYDDNPDWRLLTGLCEMLYHNHSIRNDIAGDCESIAKITPEMLYDCCKAFYAPNNMTLALAGNITMQEVLGACERHGLMQPAASSEKVQRVCAEEPLSIKERRASIKMPVSKPCFGIGFKEAPIAFGDLATEALYGIIIDTLCGGMSSLYRTLYDANLVNPGFDGEVLRVDGACAMLFTGQSEEPARVEEMLLAEIERMRIEGVDEEIFTLCKNQKYGEMIENLENVEDSASQMASFALAGQTVAQQLTMFANLSKADADAAMQIILSPERVATLLILPDGSAQEYDEDDDFEGEED